MVNASRTYTSKVLQLVYNQMQEIAEAFKTVGETKKSFGEW